MTIHENLQPDLGLFSDTPVFNTKAVVQQTGIAAPTLRAWERRYGLLSPQRANNDYRLYSARDIALIRWLKARIDAGMSISKAIALFQHMQQEHLATVSSTKINYPVIPDMPRISKQLIEAFRHLDEASATLTLGSLLTTYPIEQLCTELIAPTLKQIGELWANGQITVTVEHFASNFFRSVLTNLFQVTPAPHEGPLAIACCAPGEHHELAALMLALLLHRQQTRVAYLGQSIEIDGLLHTIKNLSPALVCISLTMREHLPALIQLATQVQQLPTPRPVFSFGGQAFAHDTHVISQIPGIYLDGDLQDVVAQLHRMVAECSENKN